MKCQVGFRNTNAMLVEVLFSLEPMIKGRVGRAAGKVERTEAGHHRWKEKQRERYRRGGKRGVLQQNH